MLDRFFSAQFKKDYKRAVKQGLDVDLLLDVVELLAQEVPLEPKHREHPLGGNYAGFRECHITPDWLLIYKKEKARLLLVLTRTGTHSELFGK